MGLGPYLAGLIEGDGYIYTPAASDSSATAHKGVPQVEIVFDIRDVGKLDRNTNSVPIT